MRTITIICKDHVGVIAKIAEALEKNGVSIRDITAQSLGGRGAVVISASGADNDKVVPIVKALGFTPLVQDSLVIKLKDKPGELAKVTRILKRARISIQTMHIIGQEKGSAFAALITDRPEKTRALLRRMLVR